MTSPRARRRHRLPALVAVPVTLLAFLSGCASGPAGGDAPASAPLGTVWPAAPEGEVIGQGTVMDTGDGAELCLGPIAESYPPQCSGIPLDGWSWEGLDGAESSGSVTWGAYAVPGTYDGERFTVTGEPIMLALYDPMMTPDPTGGEPGAGTETRLAEIQEEVHGALGDAVLASTPDNGYLWVDVVWDDGTWQTAADAEFGADLVIIRPALRVVG